MVDKLPPYDAEAEDCTIGSILIDSDVFPDVRRKVIADDFYSEINMRIFEACEALHSRKERINPVTLAQELKRLGWLEECGGASGLSYLVSIVPTSLDAEYYAEIVRRLSVNRQLITLAREIENEAFEANPDTNATIDKAIKIVRDFSYRVSYMDDLITPDRIGDELLKMVSEYSEPAHSISWGFKALDNLTAGIFPELTVIGARPSIGKTQLMVDIAESMLDKKILFCSAEMGLRGLLERKVSKRLNIDVVTLRRGNLSSEDLSKISDLSGEVAEQGISYLPPGITSMDIYNRVNRLKETTGVDIIFVDYLQILKDCWITSKENMRIRVGTACKTLKSIVNDFNVPVLCASQLSRESEYRSEENQKPRLADLRESGDIEQDADNVFLLWRDKDGTDSRILEIKLAKGRQIGTYPHVKLVWVEKQRRYADLAKE